MSLSPQFKQRAMTVILDSYLERFQAALALSASRGRYKGDVPRLVARLATMRRQSNIDFNAWVELTNEAGRTFDEWYDWYRREYSTPLEVFFNFSIDEWCMLGGLSGIAETLRAASGGLEGVVIVQAAAEAKKAS